MLHVPVLLKECIDALVCDEEGKYVDVTFGAGNHSRHIIDRLSANGHLYGFDQDDEARGNALDDTRFTFIHSNFRFLGRYKALMGPQNLNGVFADLGMSSMQVDSEERGFSFRFDAPLDMRMSSTGQTAADVLNTLSAKDLQQLLSAYGEVRNAKTLSHAIVEQRKSKLFNEVSDLKMLLDRMARGERKRYFAQVFQALRIYVNDEMKALEEMLEAAYEMLIPGGRLVVLTYHSLEDRMVKYFMKSGNVKGELIQDDFGKIHRPFKLINKKPIAPTAEEIVINPRARSAKLRIAEKQC